MFEIEDIEKLNPSELSVYEYIIKNSLDIPYMTIRELSQKASVSTATIQRFCKKLGYDGFQEFKYVFRKSMQEVNNYKDFDFLEVMDCLNKMGNPVYKQRFNAAIELIGNADSVVFFGVGDSGAVAQYAARRFSTVGKFALAVSDPYYKINYVGHKFVAVILSVSGETAELLRELNECKKAGCPIIAITSSGDSSIARLSDVMIPYYIKRYQRGSLEMTSQVPALAIIENLAKLCMLD